MPAPANLSTAIEHHQTGRLAEAEQLYRQLLQSDPANPQLHYLFALLFDQRAQPAQVIASYRRALELNPHHLPSLTNLAACLSEQGHHDEAIATLSTAIRLNPTLPQLHYNLGLSQVAIARFDQAIASFQHAIDLDAHSHPAPNNYPLARYSLGQIHLLKGDFPRGLAAYELRFPAGLRTPRDYPQPRWDGADAPDKTILLYDEQGFGDTIQFIRYAPLLAQRCGRVLLQCQPELIRLFRSIPGIAQILSPADPLPPFDLHCPLPTLPLLFKTDANSIPAQVPYLHPPRDLIEWWQHRLAPDRRPRIGLAWAGNPQHKNDRNRSIPLSTFAPLLALRNISFHSLQIGASAQSPLIDQTAQLADFADTAALISNLNLVISVDTAIAHLVGALGKNVWTLLPHVPDWRWMLNRPDTPWYPTMRLFRQPTPGDWQTPIRQIIHEVSPVLRNHP